MSMIYRKSTMTPYERKQFEAMAAQLIEQETIIAALTGTDEQPKEEEDNE